ncbi:MAG: ATP synthase F1 subunit delta [Bacteroidales bacterium]
MNESKISVRYAKAFFLTAKEEKVLEEIAEDVKLLQTSLKVTGFQEFLESPIIKTSEKKKLIDSVFEKEFNKLTYIFLNLILKNKREHYLRDILRNFIDLYKEEHGIKQAKLTMSSSVSNEYQQKFISLLEKAFNAKIELEEFVDKDLIGGFILKVEDQQFDASVKTQLKRVKKKLLETSLVNN